jgi:hypothetical protein
MPRERLVDEHTGPSTEDRRMMGRTGPIGDPQAATRLASTAVSSGVFHREASPLGRGASLAHLLVDYARYHALASTHRPNQPVPCQAQHHAASHRRPCVPAARRAPCSRVSSNRSIRLCAALTAKGSVAHVVAWACPHDPVHRYTHCHRSQPRGTRPSSSHSHENHTRKANFASHRSPQRLLAALLVDTIFIVAVAAMDSIYHVPRPCRSAVMPLLHVFVSQADPCCLGSTQHVSCIAVTALRDRCLLRARCACSPAASCITRAANAVSLAPIPSSLSIIVGVNRCPINADQS